MTGHALGSGMWGAGHPLGGPAFFVKAPIFGAGRKGRQHMDAYTGFAEVYDLFMDNVPYEKWRDRIVELLREYKVEDGLVLDLGCGTGTLTELLAEAGYDMIGVDNSQEMLEAALFKKQESQSEILYLCQDMRELNLYSTVGTVISVCDSVNYLLEDEDVEKNIFPGEQLSVSRRAFYL